MSKGISVWRKALDFVITCAFHYHVQKKTSNNYEYTRAICISNLFGISFSMKFTMVHVLTHTHIFKVVCVHSWAIKVYLQYNVALAMLWTQNMKQKNQEVTFTSYISNSIVKILLFFFLFSFVGSFKFHFFVTIFIINNYYYYLVNISYVTDVCIDVHFQFFIRLLSHCPLFICCSSLNSFFAWILQMNLL